jgi:hypothetical protein
MGKRTLLVLVLLVAGLAFLRLQRARETARGGPALGEFPLCPELAAERVRALRVEHLERSFQIKFERDAAGRWFLTDPVHYPAQSALVRTLLATLEGARGEPAPEADLAQVGLDPPQVVIECTLAAQEGGGERRVRIELGALDVDPSRIYARVPGHPSAAVSGCDVFRTTRVLANTLERFPDDYRDRRATALPAQEVVALRRRGQVYLEEEGRVEDLLFDALLGPDGWKRVGELPTVSLDPSAMGLLARGATELAIERFVDDSPQDLTRWGLDPPAFTLEIELVGGETELLSFGNREKAVDVPVAERVWYCQRQGYAHVWEVRTRDVELLTRPAELFFDQFVMRALRTDVARLELEGGGTRRVLAREKKGWSVREESGAVEGATGEGGASAQPGNASAIEEALALLERVQLAEHLESEPFEPCQPPCSFAVVLQNGTRFAGALGRATRDPKSAAEGRQYLRAGDAVVALIDVAVYELCQRPGDDFRSRKVHEIQESLLRVIELEHGGKSYAFVNTGDNVWNPKGQSIRAPDAFLQSLDGLLNLGAKRWLAAVPEHEQLLSVRLLSTQSEETLFSFARAPDGTYLWLGAGGQAAEIDGAVVERLLHLF